MYVLQVLRELGWSYVSVVHTETAYGTTGFDWNDGDGHWGSAV